MAFTRKALADLGLEEDQIGEVMRLHGAHMRNFISNTDLEEQIRQAEERGKNSVEPSTVKVEESTEYQSLLSQFNAYKTGRELVEKFGVKSKFADAVAKMVDPSKDLASQIDTVRTDFEEYFELAQPSPTEETPEEPEGPKPTPVFGGKSKGVLPKGDEGSSFMDFWGFNPKNN